MKEITKLRDETIKLLLDRPASLPMDTIAKEIGVSTSWLNTLARRKIANPGVVTIETLNLYLKKACKKG